MTSALDTVVSAAIIELLKKLQGQTGVSILFIGHDLSLVSSFTDHIVILHAGMVVEQGPVTRFRSALRVVPYSGVSPTRLRCYNGSPLFRMECAP